MLNNEKVFTPDTQNRFFRLAADYVNYTSEHVFLTGKAGTGKTTFLKYIKEHTHKAALVAAPTGVAAINAEGVTLHSLFQLPFEPFVPTFEGRRSYLSGSRFRMNKTKIELLRKAELLIIDEVSMLRADILDAIDQVLKHYRRSDEPFGGLQMLYIGDLFQLPPVVVDEEWAILKQYYQSPFFFHAKVIEKKPPIYIELKKIYRQSEQRFINLLNAIRENEINNENLELLKSRYNPYFQPKERDKYITLCTHNYKADRINQTTLNKLSAKEHSFEGEINGDFPENILPTDKSLVLKEGAQIMFIKNDTREPRRYYNGKIATISQIKKGKITVALADSDISLELEKEIWKNIRYTQNKENGAIEEEELGSFVQYPVRLAWAITVHKSQGLTFEKAIIDAGKAFAPGQVYVALSRCTTLDGIVLLSAIHPDVIMTDPFVLRFATSEQDEEELRNFLKEQKRIYCRNKLIETFDFANLQGEIQNWKNTLPDMAQLSCFEASMQMSNQLMETTFSLCETGRKFQKQLIQLITELEQSNSIEPLKDRVVKGTEYFRQVIEKEILETLQNHQVYFKKERKLKEYLKTLESLKVSICYFLNRLDKVYYGEIILSEKETGKKPSIIVNSKKESVKQQKGSSAAISLNMYNRGQTIKQIAKERGLTLGTIESHLCTYISTGEISVQNIISDEIKIETILEALKDYDGTALSPIKEQLGEEFSYAEIRAVIEHVAWQKNKEII